MKEIIQIGLFEVKMDPEKRSDDPAQCPNCVNGVCHCEPEDELEDQEEE